MPRVTRDDGAVAVLVALLAIALFAMGALVIDLGALYAERRELQNGADAAALAIGEACGAGACPTPAQARSQAVALADRNALDDATSVGTICSNDPSLRDGTSVTTCGFADTALQTRLDALSAMGVPYVAVATDTLTADDGPAMPLLLGGALGAEPTDVGAVSVVAWGTDAGGAWSGIPLIISACEWEIWTAEGSRYASPEPPYASTAAMPWLAQVEIKTHNPQGTTPMPCRSGGGFNSDIPGGFGWLDVIGKGAKIDVSECYADSDADGTVDSKQGVLPCADIVLEAALTAGVPVNIPIFTEEPVKNEYLISGQARFFITGYYVSGMGDRGRHLLLSPTWSKDQPVPANVPTCITTPNEDCVTGFFLNDAELSTGLPTAPSFGGSAVVTLVE